MTLKEIYDYYGNNWCTVVRELKIGSTTIQTWRKRGFIPIRSQMVIEQRTNGAFKANVKDAKI